MASAEQIKALLKSHIEQDDPHFYSVAMQVAAHEAKLGHGKLAQELRTLIDQAKKRKQTGGATSPVLISQPRGELAALLSASYPKLRLSDMVLDRETSNRLARILKEQRQITKIRSHGLSPRRKLLLVGPPGTGKTMSASALAGELGLPLFVVRLEGLITKFMGETAAKLRVVFDAIAQARGVYLFDEFDSIGSHRAQLNDVGEIRRVLNSFLQMIEQDDSDSLILAATNHPDILDYALFRRFDDVIKLQYPDQSLIQTLLEARLAAFGKSGIIWQELIDLTSGLSYADISRACDDAIKDAIIHDRTALTNSDISKALEERKSFPAQIILRVDTS